MRRISVLDPILHVRPDHTARVLGAARSLGLRAKLALQCRFEAIRPEFLDQLEGLDVTLEFGLQTTSPDEGAVIQRKNDLAKVDAALRMVQERGFDHEVSLIYGLPMQTLGSFRASVDWCLDRGIPRVLAWPLMLLRGTHLAATRAEWGLVESEARIPIVVASHSFTREDHAAMAELAEALRIQAGSGLDDLA